MKAGGPAGRRVKGRKSLLRSYEFKESIRDKTLRGRKREAETQRTDVRRARE